ncbi:hypothetical protein C8R43DRAFT_1232534 [Mycena crocata]|nr:hypothetical protein C8R43DRAFT_1232534 [Mycena crocata]
MPRPSSILISGLPFALMGFMYYEHRRLLAAYPTLRVPPALEISARRDKPAFGMSIQNDSGSTMKSANDTGEPWMRTHAGDLYAATIPKRLLFNSAPEKYGSDGPLIAFARAFWGSWPLRLESHIVRTLARIGVLFQLRGGHVGPREQNLFANTARILGGLFVVEAHDSATPIARSGDTFAAESSQKERFLGPIIASWWLRPTETKPLVNRDAAGVLGGYHSFAVEDLQPTDGEEPSVRLLFVSHLTLSKSPTRSNSSAELTSAESIATAQLQGLSLRQRIVMHFHAIYSRLLLDLAVKRLESAANIYEGCQSGISKM